MSETSADVVKRYLEDAIAAQRSFETQLQDFANETNDEGPKELFRRHAIETRQQHERLTARLETLGGAPSRAKSLLAHIFRTDPKTAQIGTDLAQRTTRNLLLTYAVENSEIAMYEVIAAIAEAAGDNETSDLARGIQNEQKSAAETIWQLLPDSVLRLLGPSSLP